MKKLFNLSRSSENNSSGDFEIELKLELKIEKLRFKTTMN